MASTQSFLRPLTVEAGLADGLTMHTTSEGADFIQLYQRVPFGEYLVLPFEKTFDPAAPTKWARENWWFPIGCVTMYLLFIGLGTEYMKKREPFGLRMPLAYWNLFLSLFSFAGAMHTVPDLLWRLGSEPFLDTICSSAKTGWGSGSTGLWVMLFIFSKVPELIDTVFIVLRKKKLLFLHWYHHVTVLLYCWHSYAHLAPQALYFVAMNYSVHAVMYGYYFLMAMNLKFAWVRPDAITSMQIMQMMVGVFIQVTAMYQFHYRSETCPHLSASNVCWGALMYGSYFYLFAQFAVNRYIFKVNKRAAAKAAATTGDVQGISATKAKKVM